MEQSAPEPPDIRPRLARRSVRLGAVAMLVALVPLVLLARFTTRSAEEAVRQEVAARLRLTTTMSVVADGAAAVSAAATGRYDAVLMDCHMPIMDGFEVAATIRRSEPNGTRLPIIALTASAFESDKRRCLDVGMDEHIAKPVRTEALAEVLTRFVSADRGPGDPG
jgi:CheY-like chemotaxis protein